MTETVDWIDRVLKDAQGVLDKSDPVPLEHIHLVSMSTEHQERKRRKYD